MKNNGHGFYFPNLDGLRFLAFLFVFMLHTNQLTLFSDDHSIFHRLISNIQLSGYLGVNAFFVLSGFLITSLLLQEKANTGKYHLFNFYLRRILRIWPMYFFIVIVGVVLGYFLPDGPFAILDPQWYKRVIPFLTNFSLAYDWTALHTQPAPLGAPMAILWSVAVEEQYYLVFPILLIIAPSRYYLWLFLIVIVMSIVFRFSHRTESYVLTFHTFSVVSDIFVGSFFACLSWTSVGFVNFLKTLERGYIGMMYGLLFLLIIFRKHLFLNEYSIVFERLVYSLFFIFIILEQNFSDHSFVKLSSFKLLSKVGKYTYSLYCIHFSIIIGFVWLFQSHGLNPASSLHYIVISLLALGVCIGGSLATYSLIEKPFLKLKRYF